MKIYEDACAITSEEKTIYFLICDGHRADIVLTVPPALQNSLALLTSAQARTSSQSPHPRLASCWQSASRSFRKCCKHSSRCNSCVCQRLQCNPAMELAAKRCQDWARLGRNRLSASYSHNHHSVTFTCLNKKRSVITVSDINCNFDNLSVIAVGCLSFWKTRCFLMAASSGDESHATAADDFHWKSAVVAAKHVWAHVQTGTTTHTHTDAAKIIQPVAFVFCAYNNTTAFLRLW